MNNEKFKVFNYETQTSAIIIIVIFHRRNPFLTDWPLDCNHCSFMLLLLPLAVKDFFLIKWQITVTYLPLTSCSFINKTIYCSCVSWKTIELTCRGCEKDLGHVIIHAQFVLGEVYIQSTVYCVMVWTCYTCERGQTLAAVYHQHPRDRPQWWMVEPNG